jgi:hypothetical protein
MSKLDYSEERMILQRHNKINCGGTENVDGSSPDPLKPGPHDDFVAGSRLSSSAVVAEEPKQVTFDASPSTIALTIDSPLLATAH